MAVAEKYQHDEAALSKLEHILDEPLSVDSKNKVMEINKQGIALYNENAFDQALACFSQAYKEFPKHVGIILNVSQSLIGKRQAGDHSQTLLLDIQKSLHEAAGLIDEHDDQYDRFQQLIRLSGVELGNADGVVNEGV